MLEEAALRLGALHLDTIGGRGTFRGGGKRADEPGDVRGAGTRVNRSRLARLAVESGRTLVRENGSLSAVV